MPDVIADILRDRGQQYGDYALQADVAQRLKEVMYTAAGEQERTLTSVQWESLDMIATKISRIICGDADKWDTWADIAGYAKLVADRIPTKG